MSGNPEVRPPQSQAVEPGHEAVRKSAGGPTLTLRIRDAFWEIVFTGIYAGDTLEECFEYEMALDLDYLDALLADMRSRNQDMTDHQLYDLLLRRLSHDGQQCHQAFVEDRRALDKEANSAHE